VGRVVRHARHSAILRLASPTTAEW
jgi:hypothetical protein